MNYYADSRNGYSINSRDNYSNNLYYDYDNDDQNNYRKHQGRSCCMRKVEESFCCFPSYYNEERNEDRKEEKMNCRNCWEGTFKIYPKKEYYNSKNLNPKDECCDSNNKKEEHYANCRCHNKCCGFCGIFRHW